MAPSRDLAARFLIAVLVIGVIIEGADALLESGTFNPATAVFDGFVFVSALAAIVYVSQLEPLGLRFCLSVLLVALLVMAAELLAADLALWEPLVWGFFGGAAMTLISLIGEDDEKSSEGTAT